MASRAFPVWAEPRYRCIKRISQATNATVWLVRHNASGGMRLHVLKELHGAEKEASKDDWPREVALLTAQKHPFILPVVEVIHDEPTGELGMVTEYCDQGDLHSLLIELRRRGERVPESQLLSWLAQLCLALSHLHRQRIIHRDVKTSNIFVTADRTLKLGDFGFAKALQAQQDALVSRVGSPFYMSPEICKNQPYGTTSDVWSCGCVLYEMICLQPAFYAENMMLVLDRICAAAYDPPPPDACSDAIRQLLSEMLQLEPERRPATQEVLQHPALRPVLQQLEPPAPPPPALRARLGADSAEAEVMREAVRAAHERDEALAVEQERRQEATHGGFNIRGLSRLAERGLSLLGFKPMRAHAMDAAEDAAPPPTPSQHAVAVRLEAEAAINGMHRYLEATLGGAALAHALGVAMEALPDEGAADGAWAAWEDGRHVALAALLRSGAEGARRDETAAAAASSPAGMDSDALARAILALALWQGQADEAAAAAAYAPNVGVAIDAAGSSDSSTGVFSVRGRPWTFLGRTDSPQRAR